MVAYNFKSRFIVPISLGLGIAYRLDDVCDIDAKPKRQTIRAIGKRRHACAGEFVQLYTGMRTRQCRQIGVARCASVDGVLLKWSEWQSFDTFPIAETDPGVYRRCGPLAPIEDKEAFAQADGFASFADMEKFWFENHGMATFTGLLIKWEPLS